MKVIALLIVYLSLALGNKLETYSSVLSIRSIVRGDLDNEHPSAKARTFWTQDGSRVVLTAGTYGSSNDVGFSVSGTQADPDLIIYTNGEVLNEISHDKFPDTTEGDPAMTIRFNGHVDLWGMARFLGGLQIGYDPLYDAPLKTYYELESSMEFYGPWENTEIANVSLTRVGRIVTIKFEETIFPSVASSKIYCNSTALLPFQADQENNFIVAMWDNSHPIVGLVTVSEDNNITFSTINGEPFSGQGDVGWKNIQIQYTTLVDS